MEKKEYASPEFMISKIHFYDVLSNSVLNPHDPQNPIEIGDPGDDEDF